MKMIRIMALPVAMLLIFGCQISHEKRMMTSDVQQLIDQNNDKTFDTLLSNYMLEQSAKEALVPTQSNVGKKVPVLEKRFDLVAEEVPAKTFFLSLVQDTNYNVTVHPGLDGKITLQMKKVTIPEVLETVRNVYGYDYHQTSQGIEILPATLQTRAFSVNYLDMKRGGISELKVAAASLTSGSTSSDSNNSETESTSSDSSSSNSSSTTGTVNSQVTTSSKADFWTELKTAVETIIGSGEGRKVATSPLSSLIVVQAMPNELKRVEEFLKKAEVSLNRQVILEAKILEVNLNEGFQAGINWALLSGKLRAAQYGGNVINSDFALNDNFPIQTTEAISQPINITPNGETVNPATNVGAFGGVFALAFNYKKLASFIELLSAQGDVHVLSSPRVSTINNQKALIKVGFDQYFITDVSTTPGTTNNQNQTTGNVTNVSFNPFFSGVALDVTPHITENDEVTLHIHPTISSVQDDTKTFTLSGTSQSVPLAKSSVRESDSLVRARNGEMVVIGGLMQNQTSSLKEGIPVLSKLPVIGQMFRQTVQTTKKSELVIVLRPIIVSDLKTSRNIVNDSISRIQSVHEEIDQNENPYR